jgi:hypothetical protein
MTSLTGREEVFFFVLSEEAKSFQIFPFSFAGETGKSRRAGNPSLSGGYPCAVHTGHGHEPRLRRGRGMGILPMILRGSRPARGGGCHAVARMAFGPFKVLPPPMTEVLPGLRCHRPARRCTEYSVARGGGLIARLPRWSESCCLAGRVLWHPATTRPLPVGGRHGGIVSLVEARRG